MLIIDISLLRLYYYLFFFFSSRIRHTRLTCDWSSDVCSSDLSFRAYADHMETDEFRGELARLLALAQERPTAVLCAEAVPWRCHRQLIADALVARGFGVIGRASCRETG